MQVRKIKPVILDEVEKYFKIRLDESVYFKLLKNDTFKEYFVRKLDEHVNYKEFRQILIRKSQIFSKFDVSNNDRIGYLLPNQIHRHCLIKQLIKTFYSCYTFTCSIEPLNEETDNSTEILDHESEYRVEGFAKYTIKQRYLLSYIGKNIVTKIHLNKTTFLRNGLKTLEMQLHEPNTYPRRLESLIHTIEIIPDGFRQLYTYTFLHVRRLLAPYKSNCTQRVEYKYRRECEDLLSRQNFDSLLFGGYYSVNGSFDNLSLGLNLQYFYYKYNQHILEKITLNCSIKTSMEQCDEYIYYMFVNQALPNDKMILQLMVPINANYLCQDRPKLELSEYLLKCLSIVNFWFGFTIIQMMFDLHDDLGGLYRKVMKVNRRRADYLINEGDGGILQKYVQYGGLKGGLNGGLKNGLKNGLNGDLKKDRNYLKNESTNNQIRLSIAPKKVNRKEDRFNWVRKLFKSAKYVEHPDGDEYLLNAYLHDASMNRAILYRNLQLNNWIYNPLTYSPLKSDDLAFRLNRNYLTYNSDLKHRNSSTNHQNKLDLNKVVQKAIGNWKDTANYIITEKDDKREDKKEDERKTDANERIDEKDEQPDVNKRIDDQLTNRSNIGIQSGLDKVMNGKSIDAFDEQINKRIDEVTGVQKENNENVKSVSFRLPSQSSNWSNDEGRIHSNLASNGSSNRVSTSNRPTQPASKWSVVKDFFLKTTPNRTRVYHSPDPKVTFN